MNKMEYFSDTKAITNGEFRKELKKLDIKELLVLMAFELKETQLRLDNLRKG